MPLSNYSHKPPIQRSEKEDVDWIDALSETSIKAVERFNVSLCNEGLYELQSIAGNFLTSSKSISHHATDPQSEKIRNADKVSFTLFYFFQRMEMINDKAIEFNLEPCSSAVITNLGKIVVNAAKFDISLAASPIYIFGKYAKRLRKNLQK